MFAVVRVRGRVDLRRDFRETLEILKLNRVNSCILVPKNPTSEGMIKKVRDFVTWGEINQKTMERLVSERGRLAGNKKIDGKKLSDALSHLKKGEGPSKIEGMKPVFRLSPPKGGFKFIKKPYPKGGLGYRGEKINELLEKML